MILVTALRLSDMFRIVLVIKLKTTSLESLEVRRDSASMRGLDSSGTGFQVFLTMLESRPLVSLIGYNAI
ncbi:hypothetical protein EFP73_02605 [Lactiplantibacillus pentosus]|nr:hypothetical protein [Lactiplantibacillus pentosus]